MAYDPTTGNGATWTTPEKFLTWEVDHSRFELRRTFGKGAYGSVAEAFDHSTDPPTRVAIKRVPNVFDIFENAKRIHREISILRVLEHPNITPVLHLERPRDLATFRDLYIVFEAMDTDMQKLIADKTQTLTIPHVRWFMYQMLLGVKFIHSANIIHRDLKPANILLTEACDLKVCDFGLARVIESDIDEDAAESLAGVTGVPVDDGSAAAEAEAAASTSGAGHGSSSSSSASSAAEQSTERREGGTSAGAKPLKKSMTKHVVTRWYRAPELPLYNDGRYTMAIDVWSIGCIMAELLSMLDSGAAGHSQKRRALFPGGYCYPLSRGSKRPDALKNKKDQLQVIFDVMGTPTEEEIARVRTDEAREALRRLPKQSPSDLSARFPAADEEALDMLRSLLRFLPEDRLTVDQALAHPFLASVRRPEDEVVAPSKIVFPEVTKHNIRDMIVAEIAHYNAGVTEEWRARRRR